MRLVATDEARPGMRLGKSIYSSTGDLLLGAGVVLRPAYIERLKALGVFTIYVFDPLTADVSLEDVVSEEVRLQAMVAVREALLEAADQSRKGVDYFETRKVRLAANNIADELLTKRKTVVTFLDLKAHDDYTYAHSVNCCILGMLVGLSLGYHEIKLRNLGVGMLLHDIGKMTIPTGILNKRDELEPWEFEKIAAHTTNGFKLLQKDDEITPLSRAVCLQHHERCDGSGYPSRLDGDRIHEFSKVAAVVDVYDALTSDRVYRRASRPHEALSYLRKLSGVQFDETVVARFLEHVAPYPVGTIVELSNGARGIVVRVNKADLGRPVVRLLGPCQGRDESRGQVEDPGRDRVQVGDLDLSRESDVFIVRVIEG